MLAVNTLLPHPQIPSYVEIDRPVHIGTIVDKNDIPTNQNNNSTQELQQNQRQRVGMHGSLCCILFCFIIFVIAGALVMLMFSLSK